MTVQSKAPILQARDVVRKLGPARQTILHGISLDIADGEFVALTGASGSGKSTLLYLLGALDRPDSGSLLWRGRDLVGLDDDERAEFRNENLGFVFQFHFLLPEFSVLENVSLPMRRRGDRRADAEARARETLGRLGLAELEGRRPHQLSGGQQQRVAIARAVAHGPQVLLADEPTGNLDSANAAAVFGMLRALVEEQGTTVVVVTHDTGFAAQARRRIVLKDGVIVEDLRAAD